MMNVLIETLARQAGFSGSDLSNTQVGTCHETALQNFKELIEDRCAKAAEEYWNDAALQKAFTISEYIFAVSEE